MRFLVRDATREELRAACVDNHLVWLRRLTQASGGQVRIVEGLETATTQQPMAETTVVVVGPPTPTMRDEVDKILAECRATGVERLSFWAADDASDDASLSRLGVWLEARGMRAGEQPRWMGLDLHSLPTPPTAKELAQRYDVTMPTRFDDWRVPELMCFGPDSWQARQAMVHQQPQRVWHGVLWQDGAPAGQLSFNATEGELGVVGLHNFVILPGARVRGPGLDRFDWVTRFCLDLGCRYLVANAIERAVPLYKMMNFQELGKGYTWWATTEGIAERPAEQQVRLAEAIGEGDLDGVQRATAGWDGAQFDRRLANGLTPLRYAALRGQPEAAMCLLSRGATPDILAAWDLGWRDDVDDLLSRNPASLHARGTRSGKTLLHIAVERNDPDLARLLLAAGADPAQRDHRFHATPLDWAVKMRMTRVAAILRSHVTREGVSDT
jgi:hypothetical protein